MGDDRWGRALHRLSHARLRWNARGRQPRNLPVVGAIGREIELLAWLGQAPHRLIRRLGRRSGAIDIVDRNHDRTRRSDHLRRVAGVRHRGLLVRRRRFHRRGCNRLDLGKLRGDQWLGGSRLALEHVRARNNTERRSANSCPADHRHGEEADRRPHRGSSAGKMCCVLSHLVAPPPR